MQVTAHTLFRNEEKWLWYSVMSVIDHVDRVLLWDMGSTDGSLEIAEEIKGRYPTKVSLRKISEVNEERFAEVRQKMLDETDSDWFIVIDGDEIWWEDSITKLLETVKVKGNEIESIVVPTVNLVGDIFHYQGKETGKYRFGKRTGHYNLRAVKRSIPGLGSKGRHGVWGWVDGKGKMIQERQESKVFFVDASYLHATHVPRAGNIKDDAKVMKRSKKLKYELGNEVPLDQYYPEVFFRERPNFVSSPWNVMEKSFYIRALVETPLRKIKRRLVSSPVGY